MSSQYQRLRDSAEGLGTPFSTSPPQSAPPSRDSPYPPSSRNQSPLPTSPSQSPFLPDGSPRSINAHLGPYGDPYADPVSLPPSRMSFASIASAASWNDERTALRGSTDRMVGKMPASPYYNPEPEDDDDLHNPDADTRGSIFTPRGVANLGCLFVLVILIVGLFAGLPILSYILPDRGITTQTSKLNSWSQFNLIDPDTPADAMTHTSLETGDEWQLVFSDEFNRDGRTFREGDDPWWSAVDLHYWATGNKEWYDPDNIYTRDGHLVIEFNDKISHNLNYTGGMLQSWNRFCFTGGYIEAEVSLPGNDQVAGLWPAVWTMGNLGRAGYGGSLEGLWPYTYDSCDYGTFPNQTKDDAPKIATDSGTDGGPLSYLQGQRLSRCTCPNDTHHPGPKHSDGTFVGRAAPEIDVFEALVNTDAGRGQVSLSAQWAPFNPEYKLTVNDSDTTELYNPDEAYYNSYTGGIWQQASSALAYTDPDSYTNGTGSFSKYGFEYQPGDDGYITWVSSGNKTWTIRQPAMAPYKQAKVGQRLVSVEPMYIILNLGLSESFGPVDYEGINALLPVEMQVNYVRVYQDPNNINVGCDTADYPTADYIESILPAYTNPNITTWDQLSDFMGGLQKPRNQMYEGSC